MDNAGRTDSKAHTESAFWDERFKNDGQLFGTRPAAFLRTHAGHIKPGSRVLCVGDGQGRNSLYLAGLGHDVTAFDVPPVGVERAREMAAETGVAVNYQVAGIENWDWSQTYDVVCAVFVQFAPPALRKLLFGWIAGAVAPGGVLLLHGYAPRQVGYGTGGPPFAENMYELPMLHEAFAGWGVVRAADYDAEVDEGAGHSGRSALIDFVAVKP